MPPCYHPPRRVHNRLYGIYVVPLFQRGEAGDTCEYGGIAGPPLADYARIGATSAQQSGYAVDYYWSNRDGACIPQPRTITLNATRLPAGVGDVVVDGGGTTTPFAEAVPAGTFHSISFTAPVDDPANPQQVRYVTSQLGYSGAVATDVNLTAAYTPQYYLTVQTNPLQVASFPSSLMASGWQPGGSTVQLTADTIVSPGVTGERYLFSGWSGDASGTSTSTSVTMNSAHTVIANYTLQDLLTVTTSGLGSNTTSVFNGSSLLGSASDNAPFSQYINEGTPLTLGVDQDISLANGSQLLFTGFNPAPPGALSAPTSILATYQTMAAVIAAALNSGGISGGGAAGLANSYAQRWPAVEADFANARYSAAVSAISSFEHHVDAHSGKHLTADFAIELDRLADAAYANAEAQEHAAMVHV